MVYKHTACCFITADLHLGPLHKHCQEVKDPLLTGSMWMMGTIATAAWVLGSPRNNLKWMILVR